MNFILSLADERSWVDKKNDNWTYKVLKILFCIHEPCLQTISSQFSLMYLTFYLQVLGHQALSATTPTPTRATTPCSLCVPLRTARCIPMPRTLSLPQVAVSLRNRRNRPTTGHTPRPAASQAGPAAPTSAPVSPSARAQRKSHFRSTYDVMVSVVSVDRVDRVDGQSTSQKFTSIYNS